MKQMYKANNNNSIMAAIFAAMLFSGLLSSGISPRLQQKLENAVETTFEVEDYQLEWVDVEAEKDALTELEFQGQHFFKVVSGNSLVGYGYLGEAASKKNVFDFVVLFTPELTIKKSKVLIYREDYGRQIGSQRWLVQFIGMSTEDTPVYGENIDAISGATISASSMTRAVAGVLEGVRTLKKDLIP